MRRKIEILLLLMLVYIGISSVDCLAFGIDPYTYGDKSVTATVTIPYAKIGKTKPKNISVWAVIKGKKYKGKAKYSDYYDDKRHFDIVIKIPKYYKIKTSIKVFFKCVIPGHYNNYDEWIKKQTIKLTGKTKIINTPLEDDDIDCGTMMNGARKVKVWFRYFHKSDIIKISAGNKTISQKVTSNKKSQYVNIPYINPGTTIYIWVENKFKQRLSLYLSTTVYRYKMPDLYMTKEQVRQCVGWRYPEDKEKISGGGEKWYYGNEYEWVEFNSRGRVVGISYMT